MDLEIDTQVEMLSGHSATQVWSSAGVLGGDTNVGAVRNVSAI